MTTFCRFIAHTAIIDRQTYCRYKYMHYITQQFQLQYVVETSFPFLCLYSSNLAAF
jgi:hypothetical protein